MTEVGFRNPENIVTGDWLEQHLGDERLRIFDCSTRLVLEQGTGRPYEILNCREEYLESHIPGSDYLDLQGEFSDADSPYGMTLASPAQVAQTFARHGISDDTRVILYSRRSISWATRFWWMLRWIGFDNAAILDGGFDKWAADGRPVATGAETYPSEAFTVFLRPEVFVGKDEILQAMNDPDTCLINALSPDVHSGRDARYGRPGRIPGSVNVPKMSLVDPETLEFLPMEDIAGKFAAAGADKADRHITYCGGGIYATVDAFLLHQLGHTDIAIYDNSLSEWATDPDLPVETD